MLMFPRPVLVKILSVLQEEPMRLLPTISITRAMCPLSCVMVPSYRASHGGTVEEPFLSSVLILEMLNITFLG